MSLGSIPADSILIIMLALAAGSAVKGVTGLGLPLIAIPIMANFLGVERAVVIMVIPGIVSNTWLLWVHRAHAGATRHLPMLLLAGTVGIGVGTWVLVEVSERILSLLLALVIGAYLINLLANPRFSLSHTAGRYFSPVAGFGAGILQGATGISSPIIATYFHALRLDKRAYVFSVTAAFQVLSMTQLVTLYQFGLFTQTRLLEGLLALLPIVIVLPLSIRLAHRISRRVFDVILIVLMIVMEFKLLYNAVYGA